MVKPKFNGGDIVRLANVDAREMSASIGATAEVINPQVDASSYFYNTGEPIISVRWIENQNLQNDGDYLESMFELVRTEETAASGARYCFNDNVEVYDATGETLADGLRNAAAALDEWDDYGYVRVDIANIDGYDCVTIYRHL